jgi:hypothetical protein
MNGIKIKERQIKCVDRWVLKAVYIPDEIRRMLIESITTYIQRDGYIHIKFNDKSISYLSENCPIHFLQRDARQLVIAKSII